MDKKSSKSLSMTLMQSLQFMNIFQIDISKILRNTTQPWNLAQTN